MEKPPLLRIKKLPETIFEHKLDTIDTKLNYLAGWKDGINAQRDADVEWYEKGMTTVSVANLIEKARQEVAREIFKEIEKWEEDVADGRSSRICIPYMDWQSLNDKYNKQSIGR